MDEEIIKRNELEIAKLSKEFAATMEQLVKIVSDAAELRKQNRELKGRE